MEIISSDPNYRCLSLLFIPCRMTDNQADISETQMETIPKVGVTDAQRELANNAHVEFESRQYDR